LGEPGVNVPARWEWEHKDFVVRDVKLKPEHDLSSVDRVVTYSIVVKKEFQENIFPIYVPPAPQASQQSTATTKSAGATDVVTTDAYWAKASDQARSTSKWIATALGAALLAIVGTAPLSSLGGKHIDWFSLSGALVAAGLFLLGVTMFMVISVLVPGITTFGDLMKPIRGWKVWMSIPKAREDMADRTADQHGVQFPIGVNSLNELGHRIRIDEMTLEKISKSLARETDKDRITKWTKIKEERGQWLQSLIDETTRWVIVGSYLSIKVKSERARSIGLACGLLGGAFVVIGYIGLQAPATQETVTYAVVPSDTNSQTRKTLGTSCDAFTAVPVASDTARNTVTLYVVGGKGCTVNQRVVLPTSDLARVTPSPTPTKTS
jgi:hypothetical protein